MDPGVCPATGITVRSQVPTATLSPAPTRRSTLTPVCSSMASASGAPATTVAPGWAAFTAASARWWSQCWWVVTIEVSERSPTSSSSRSGSAAASMRTSSSVSPQWSR